MKTLMILIALDIMLVLATSDATEPPYMLVLVTVAEQFETQMGAFESLRECTDEGARLLTDQDLYIGFGCVTEESLPK